jgi:hypothetical protein
VPHIHNNMDSPDYREQFNHALSILNAVNIGHVHVVDGLAFGSHHLCESKFSQKMHPVSAVTPPFQACRSRRSMRAQCSMEHSLATAATPKHPQKLQLLHAVQT